jgi:hypothetical protein
MEEVDNGRAFMLPLVTAPEDGYGSTGDDNQRRGERPR